MNVNKTKNKSKLSKHAKINIFAYKATHMRISIKKLSNVLILSVPEHKQNIAGDNVCTLANKVFFFSFQTIRNLKV